MYLKSSMAAFLLDKFSRNWAMEINAFKAILENGTKRRENLGFQWSLKDLKAEAVCISMTTFPLQWSCQYLTSW